MAHPHDKSLGNAGIVVIDSNTGAFASPTNADGEVIKHVVAITKRQLQTEPMRRLRLKERESFNI